MAGCGYEHVCGCAAAIEVKQLVAISRSFVRMRLCLLKSEQLWMDDCGTVVVWPFQLVANSIGPSGNICIFVTMVILAIGQLKANTELYIY